MIFKCYEKTLDVYAEIEAEYANDAAQKFVEINDDNCFGICLSGKSVLVSVTNPYGNVKDFIVEVEKIIKYNTFLAEQPESVK